MSMPFSFGDVDQVWPSQENFPELFPDADQIVFSDGEGVSPFPALLLEGSLRHTHDHDHLIISMPLNVAQTMTNACPTQPDQHFTPSPQPVIHEQVVNRLHQCIDHSEMTGDSVKDGVHVPKKWVRGPDWRDEEKRHYLTLKMEAQGSVKGKDWDFISQNLKKRHGIRRSAKCCEDLWGTLRKNFKLISCHESNRKNHHVSYWEMGADGRARKKLPRSFPEDSFAMMESILAAQEQQRSGRNSKYMSNSKKTPANEGDDDWNNTHRGKRLEDLQIKQRVNSALQCLSESPVIGEDGDALLKLLSRAVKSAIEPFIEANLELELMKKWMMEAIHSSLVRPVASALCEERRLDGLEDEARMKVIEEKRRAPDLEELQIKRQRLGRLPSKRLGKRGSVTSWTEIER